MKRTRSQATKLLYARRELRTARVMLELAAAKFSQFSREVDPHVQPHAAATLDDRCLIAIRKDLASDMREWSSECARMAEVRR